MKHDYWGNAKLTHENKLYLHDENYIYDNAMYDEIISRALKIKDFNFMKEFLIKLLRNNVYMNIKSGKRSQNKNELYSACGVWPETRLHLFYSCQKTNDMVTFLKKTLRKAGLLTN